MKTIVLVVCALFAAVCISSCNYSQVDNIKANAAQTWDKAGFKIIGYEGYQIGSLMTPGGQVWYTVTTKEPSPIIYNGFISKWRGEYHVYSLRAINAVSTN